VRTTTAYISYLHLHPVISVLTMGGKIVGTTLQDYTMSQLSTPQSQHYIVMTVNLLLKCKFIVDKILYWWLLKQLKYFGGLSNIA